MKLEINIYLVIAILFIHWFLDFVLQTDEEAKNKSKSFSHLISHTYTYSLGWYFPVLILFVINNESTMVNYVTASMMFCIVTLTLHTLTDYYTSKLNTRLLEAKRTHDFFVSVGFDQWLHYLQLFITFQLISDNLL